MGPVATAPPNADESPLLLDWIMSVFGDLEGEVSTSSPSWDGVSRTSSEQSPFTWKKKKRT